MNYVLFPHSFSLGAAQPHRILKSIPQNLGVSASSAVCAYLLSRRSGLAHYPVHTAYTVFVIVFRVETQEDTQFTPMAQELGSLCNIQARQDKTSRISRIGCRFDLITVESGESGSYAASRRANAKHYRHYSLRTSQTFISRLLTSLLLLVCAGKEESLTVSLIAIASRFQTDNIIRPKLSINNEMTWLCLNYLCWKLKHD